MYRLCFQWNYQSCSFLFSRFFIRSLDWCFSAFVRRLIVSRENEYNE